MEIRISQLNITDFFFRQFVGQTSIFSIFSIFSIVQYSSVQFSSVWPIRAKNPYSIVWTSHMILYVLLPGLAASASAAAAFESVRTAKGTLPSGSAQNRRSCPRSLTCCRCYQTH
jgi:hypothetical protein